jgi:lincosamide nucleotidyltransferase A/C/D/E
MLGLQDAVTLCQLLERCHIQFWVMGGWGVDALLRRETRPHKDLDVLLLAGDLPTFWQVVGEQGFTLQYEWEETRWIEREGARWATAFVVADGQRRELDVHVIDLGQDGTIIQLYDPPWTFPASIAAEGSIAGVTVPCLSKETQLAMHTGYKLPEGQRRDLNLLQAD